MELVKKNIISIICGVVALLALAVAFFVVPGKASELQTQLDERKKVSDEMTSLLKKDRTLPQPDTGAEAAKPLGRFPSDPIIKQGEAIVVQLEKESVALREAAVAMNKHELLSPGALPAPSQVQAFAFFNAYKQALPPIVLPQAGQPMRGGAIESAFAKQLNAGMPPNAETITLKLQQRVEEIRQKEAFILSNGQIGNEAALKLKIDEETIKLPARLREEVANGSKVYISPDTFESYPRFAQVAGGAPDPIDIYFAQLGYWIQQDVVNAVKEVNAPAKNVMEAPVKHLASIRVKALGIPTFVTDPSGQNMVDPDGTLPKVPTISPTGRVCNGLYDVFHFQVKADVQADKVADYIRGLSRNRFITPMWIDVKAVDNATSLAQGHFYGDKPVLTVTAECEILYMRKWNAPLMPKLIRQRLAIPDEPAPGAAPLAPGAAPVATPASDTQPPDAAPPAAAPAGVPLPGDPIPGQPAPGAPQAAQGVTAPPAAPTAPPAAPPAPATPPAAPAAAPAAPPAQ